MPTFRFPDDFEDHKSYVTLLKKALLQVKGGTPKKFLYFKQYAFGAKKLPLVLVDYDLNCVGVLNKAGLKPTDEGLVSLTAQDELNFEPKKGNLKRIRLKKYFATMGGGIKPVFVPAGEVDEEAEDQEPTSAAPENAGGSAPAPQAEPPPTTTKPAPAVQPEPAAEPAPAKPSPAMQRKLQFEQKQFALRERVKKIGTLATSAPLEALKAQVLKKAEALIAAGKFADATLLLDPLEQKLASAPPGKPLPTPPQQKPLPTPPTEAQPKERKLSTYLNLNKEWDAARKSAAAELQRLEKVIATACDGEPVKDAVFKRLPQLHTLVLKIDARLSDALSAGAKATDPDKQLDLDKATRKLVGEYRGALQAHPLAAVVDENPFGSFKVLQTLEAALAKIEAEFN